MKQAEIVIPTYAKIANRYAEVYFDDLSDAPFLDKFISYLPPQAKVVDIGCGPGNFTRQLTGRGFNVKGIDLSNEMLTIARDRVPEGDFKMMDMRKLDYPDETFDGLLVAYSLIHIPSSEIPETLRGFYGVLKPNGVVLVIAQRGEPDRVVDEPLQPGEKMFVNFFTKDSMSDVLTKAGFVIEYQEEKPSQDPNSFSDAVIYTIGKKL